MKVGEVVINDDKDSDGNKKNLKEVPLIDL